MSFLSNITGNLRSVLGQFDSSSLPKGMPQLLSQTSFGSLEELVRRLEGTGLIDQVHSWLGSGANLPVSVGQLQVALGDEQVRNFAKQLGLRVDAALKLLSERLPAAVDHASPNGVIEHDSDPAQTGEV